MPIEKPHGDGGAYWDQQRQQAIDLVRHAQRSIVLYVEEPDGDMTSLVLARVPDADSAAQLMAAVTRAALCSNLELLAVAAQEAGRETE